MNTASMIFVLSFVGLVVASTGCGSVLAPGGAGGEESSSTTGTPDGGTDGEGSSDAEPAACAAPLDSCNCAGIVGIRVCKAADAGCDGCQGGCVDSSCEVVWCCKGPGSP